MTKEKNITEALSFGGNMIFISGYLNCYTFVRHGGAFATMQTGNMIQAFYNLTEGNWIKAVSFMSLNLVYLVTIFLTKLAFDFLCKQNDLKWKRMVLVYSLMLMMIVGIIYPFVPNLLVNSLVSSGAAAQYCAFRSFGNNVPYATIFCTGNMRSLVDNVYNAIIKKDAESKENAKGYLYVLGCFAFGVVFCNLMMKMMGGLAIWFVCVILFGCTTKVSREIKRMYSI